MCVKLRARCVCMPWGVSSMDVKVLHMWYGPDWAVWEGAGVSPETIY